MPRLSGVYLFTYCALQTLIHLVLVVRTTQLFLAGEYEWLAVSNIAFLGTLLQIIDVVHCLIGLTKGNIPASLVQIWGRLTMLWIIHNCPDTRDTTPAALILIVYALVEPCRYPYYGFNALGVEIYPLMWLRYSAFLPLYPAGLSLEAINMTLAIPYYYRTYQTTLFGIPVNAGVVMGGFLILVFPFIARFLLFHMLKQRKSKLGCVQHSKKSKKN
ncbi:hypothetical protein PRIPAC_94777 [Pristionchus pacificus]|uniref:Very-long-chain (3R)-3-hydroxyacyl-CoA dehydratase n=1 Tax=Pristionchus pacificus TaxID=54126 RepID=A0A454Y6M6_PRIPA|nr:hypothetical protein PRIPAC_94777 [Pristionchus pacificus]|eukprot:PDM65708.1 hpo-8 [Pristionchus pacificus]